MTPDWEKEQPVASTSSKKAAELPKDKPKRPQKKQRGPKCNQGKGKGKKMAQTLPKRVQNSHMREFSHGQCVQNGQDLYGVDNQRKTKDEQDLSIKKMDEIRYIQSIFLVKFNNFDKELNKLTSNINELIYNDRNITEWFKVTNARIESMSNKSDIIESKCEVKND
ncbi:hypothetical protein O181_032040 [Austropuccinia psidii MF-1]|uniref:Uncharacterized protein n=1 Tax=Austropuccinia psidii MF-1 TaxID=1389203 RepID=A0A9Q3H7U7_9BASI|nr:hypothetical protein [Austropuccinia psidii MF-1]